jgi:hypothetical protein
MALETGTYISDLVSTNPTGSDAQSAGDDHLRLIKSTVKATFPNLSGAVTPTHTELNYVDGVTSAIQTQLNDKAALASPAFTGTPTAPTAAGGTNTTQIATTAFVATNYAPLASPALTGTPTAPTATTGTNTTQIATTAFVQQEVASGTPVGGWFQIEEQIISGTPSTVEFDTGIGSTYDEYMVTFTGIETSSSSAELWMRTSTDGGSNYDAGSTDYRVGNSQYGHIKLNTTGSRDSPIHGFMTFFSPTLVKKFGVRYFSWTTTATQSLDSDDYYVRETNADVNALRFLPETGTFTGGTFTLLGRRK